MNSIFPTAIYYLNRKGKTHRYFKQVKIKFSITISTYSSIHNSNYNKIPSHIHIFLEFPLQKTFSYFGFLISFQMFMLFSLKYKFTPNLIKKYSTVDIIIKSGLSYIECPDSMQV